MQTISNIDTQLFMLLNGSDSSFLDGIMMVITNGVTWIPLYIALMLLVVKNNESMSQIVLICCCALACVLLSTLAADLLAKPYFARWRPSSDPVIKYTVDVVGNYRPGKYGFFSAHAANTFSLALFLSLWVRNKTFTIAMMAWSMLNCYSRIYLGAHYPSDIFVGLVVGGAIAGSLYFLCRHLYSKISCKFNYISSHYSSTGYCIADIDVVVSVLVFMILLSIISPLI